MSTHVVHRLRFDLDAGSRQQAQRVQDAMSRFASEKLPAILEQCLDGVVADDRVLVVDRLDLDLGTLVEDRLETELPSKIARAIADALFVARYGRAAGANESAIAISVHEHQAETLRRFLDYGLFEASAESSPIATPEELVESLLANTPALAELLRNWWQTRPRARRRLVTQFSQATLLQIASALLAPHSALFIHFVKTLQQTAYAPAHASGFAARVWEHVFDIVLDTEAQTLSAERLIARATEAIGTALRHTPADIANAVRGRLMHVQTGDAETAELLRLLNEKAVPDPQPPRSSNVVDARYLDRVAESLSPVALPRKREDRAGAAAAAPEADNEGFFAKSPDAIIDALTTSPRTWDASIAVLAEAPAERLRDLLIALAPAYAGLVETILLACTEVETRAFAADGLPYRVLWQLAFTLLLERRGARLDAKALVQGLGRILARRKSVTPAAYLELIENRARVLSEIEPRYAPLIDIAQSLRGEMDAALESGVDGPDLRPCDSPLNASVASASMRAVPSGSEAEARDTLVSGRSASTHEAARDMSLPSDDMAVLSGGVASSGTHSSRTHSSRTDVRQTGAADATGETSANIGRPLDGIASEHADGPDFNRAAVQAAEIPGGRVPPLLDKAGALAAQAIGSQQNDAPDARADNPGFERRTATRSRPLESEDGSAPGVSGSNGEGLSQANTEAALSRIDIPLVSNEASVGAGSLSTGAEEPYARAPTQRSQEMDSSGSVYEHLSNAFRSGDVDEGSPEGTQRPGDAGASETPATSEPEANNADASLLSQIPLQARKQETEKEIQAAGEAETPVDLVALLRSWLDHGRLPSSADVARFEAALDAGIAHDNIRQMILRAARDEISARNLAAFQSPALLQKIARLLMSETQATALTFVADVVRGGGLKPSSVDPLYRFLLQHVLHTPTIAPSALIEAGLHERASADGQTPESLLAAWRFAIARLIPPSPLSVRLLRSLDVTRSANGPQPSHEASDIGGLFDRLTRAAMDKAASARPASGQLSTYVDNAGIVLLAPYLGTLFSRLSLLENGTFRGGLEQGIGINLLQYLASGTSEVREYRLSLHKVLCCLDLSEPLPETRDLTDFERETCDGLLHAVTQSWTPLKNSSVATLREAFLQREGRLVETAEHWVLKVAAKPFDMLLDSVPWQFRLIKLRWMSSPLKVDWR